VIERNRRIATLILILGARKKGVVYITSRRVVGHQGRSGRFGEEKNLLPLPENEPQIGQPIA